MQREWASTLYADLDIEPDATDAEITAAHRKQAKRTHPDVGGSREDFERVQRAYVILRDPAKREKYDRTGDTEDAPDNEGAKRAEYLLSAFDRAMAEGNAQARDIIAAAVRFLRKDMAALDNQLANARAEIDAIAQARARLTFAGDGPNFIEKMLDGRKQAADAAIMQMEQQKGRLAVAIEMAKDYKWRADRPPVATSSAWVFA